MNSAENQKTILLVEDEVFTAMAGKIVLEKCGNKVLTAHSGEEAVATVEKSPEIDLILMDINLGAGIDGAEAAQIILRQRDLPVLFLSSHTEPEIVAKTEKISSYGFVVKHSGHTVLDASIKMAFKLFEAKTREKENESQREAALAALRESEEKYRTVADFTFDWETWRAPDGTYRYVSPSCERISGHTATEFMADANLMVRITHHEDQARIFEHFRATAQESKKQNLEFDFRILTAKGETRWISHSCTAVYGKGGQWLGRRESNRDITERKQAEAALRKSEEQYRILFENTGTAIIIIEEDTTISLVNTETLRRTGYARNDIEGKKKWTEIVDGEDIGRMTTQHQLRRENSRDALASYEFRYRTKSGELRYALLNVQLLPGTRKSMASLIDITERKQAEYALQESEVKLRAILDATPFPIALVDTQDDKIDFWSRSALTLFGHTAPTVTEWYRIAYPDPGYRRDVLARWKPFLEKARKSGQAVNTGEYRVTCRDGSVRICELYAAFLADHLIVTFNDISERKQAEKALGESEVRFRELFNRMSSGVAVYEAVDDGGDFIIRNFNPAAEKLEKVSLQDILGKRVSEAFPGVKAFGVFKVFQRVWRTGEAEYFPENLYKPEGGAGGWRESWRESWIFKLPSGEIVAIYNDISERKQAGEEIQQQLTEKEILLREVHHRIKNNIASISGLMSLQMQSVSNPEAIAVLQDAIGRVNSMRILYDKLLLTEGYKDVSVKNYVESLIASVVALFPGNAKVTIDQQIADFQLDQKRLSPLGIIINELLTNIMKHAFINRDSGLIKISLTNIDMHATLTIQDDGNGLPPGFDINQSKGFGLMLVKMLSQQLGGSFSIEKHQGTRCRLEFVV